MFAHYALESIMANNEDIRETLGEPLNLTNPPKNLTMNSQVSKNRRETKDEE